MGEVQHNSAEQAMKKSIINQIISLSKIKLAILIPFITLFFVESIFRGSSIETLKWAFSSPTKLLIEYMIIFVLMNSFYFLKKRYYLFVLVLQFILFNVFSIASVIKVQKRGEPIVPNDFLLKDEALNISQYFSLDGFYLTIGIIIIFTILGFVISFMVKKESENFKKNIILSIISILFACLLGKGLPFNPYTALKLETIGWNQTMNSQTNGSVLGFVLNNVNSTIKKPSNYSKQKVTSILDSTNESKLVSNNTSKKPNIIFIQSEAFFDPSIMANNVFKTDPLPYFHSLQKDHTTGTLITPVYGGGTINTELEIQTGLSTNFIPSVSFGFENYIDKPLNSAARIARENGYTSTGIHTYHSWFYHRDELYKKLGFNSFQPIETFLNPEQADTSIFYSDIEISKRIIETIKQTSTNDYIYAVTTENHGPYDTPIKQYTDKATSLNLSEENKKILNTYAHTLSKSDKALQMLIESIQQLNEPTIVVFYGDHLPMLGNDMSVYKNANYIKDANVKEDYIKTHSVPLLVWSNYLEKQPSITLSSSFLTPYIFQLANLPMNNTFSFLDQALKDGHSVLLPSKFQKNSTKVNKFISDYSTLQYDVLKGNQYLYQDNLKNKSYLLGNPNFKVNNVFPKAIQQGKDGQYITITGNGFSNSTIVSINGESIPISFRTNQKMQLKVPKKFYNKTGKLTVSVLIEDSNHKVIQKGKTTMINVLDHQLFTKHINKELVKINLESVIWEPFVAKDNYAIYRAPIDLYRTPYEVKLDGKIMKHKLADLIDAPGYEDAYLNGFLYISVPISDESNSNINKYMSNHLEISVLDGLVQ